MMHYSIISNAFACACVYCSGYNRYLSHIQCGCYKVCYEALELVNIIKHAMTFELGMGLKVKLH